MEHFYLLALYRLFANKPRRLAELLSNGSPIEYFSAENLQNLQIKKVSETRRGDPICKLTDSLRRELDADLQWLSQPGHHLLVLGEADYPALLAQTYDPPPLLFCSGNLSAISSPGARLAMVGSRKASRYGLENARIIAREVSESVAIVSGLAMGIDAAAHEGALAGKGTTLAVLGSGCDEIYPKRHWRLAQSIEEQGLLISEFPLRSRAYPANFPRRNRIVTGLCQATLVVEAAMNSGSLISARLALNQGREVMAVPGSVRNEGARGCHYLLKDGATLVEGADDVCREMGLPARQPGAAITPKSTLSEEQTLLLEMLASGPVSIDWLVANSHFDIAALTVNLVSLEVLGLVISGEGQYQLGGPLTDTAANQDDRD